MSFAFFDHTGDIGVHLTAPTLDHLFATAAEALMATMVDTTTIEARTAEALTLDAPDREQLLVEWLADLLYRFDSRALLVHTADVRLDARDDAWLLTATVRGEALDPARHRVKVLVKGITYHGLKIVETPDGWAASVVFDI